MSPIPVEQSAYRLTLKRSISAELAKPRFGVPWRADKQFPLFAAATRHGMENGGAGLGVLEALQRRADGLATLCREQFSHRVKSFSWRTGLRDDLHIGFLQGAGLGDPDVACRFDLFDAD